MTKHPGLPHLPDVEDYPPSASDRPLWQDLLILGTMAILTLSVALYAGYHGLP